MATNGCFDLLTAGHVRNLSDARKLGDILVVGLNSDKSVAENKGPARPVVPQHERAEVIGALESVDYVFIFDHRTPFAWIKTLRPDVHVKGGGEDVRSHPDLTEMQRFVEEAGGKLVLVPHHDGISTSELIRKIQNLA